MARRRYWRTLALAVLACGTFAWSAIYHFDVEPEVLLEILYMSLSVVGLAMLGALLVVLVKALFKRED